MDHGREVPPRFYVKMTLWYYVKIPQCHFGVRVLLGGGLHGCQVALIVGNGATGLYEPGG